MPKNFIIKLSLRYKSNEAFSSSNKMLSPHFQKHKKDNKKGKAQSISTFLHTHLLCKLREKKIIKIKILLSKKI